MATDLDHRTFLEKALTSAAEWARFADPKALAVLVLLGLGLNDLIGRSQALLLPPDKSGASCDSLSVAGQSCDQVIATASSCLAMAAAVVVVFLVTAAVFPRLRLHRPAKAETAALSLFYFEDVAKQDSADAYVTAVRSKTPEELESELGVQVFALSTVASRKHRYAMRAYIAVLVFLSLWVTARIFLALAQ